VQKDKKQNSQEGNAACIASITTRFVKLVRTRSLRLMYTELHARSGFSFLEGASVPEELAAACNAYGMPAMAVLDRDGVYGAPRFILQQPNQSEGAHWLRSDFRLWLALSAAREIARRLSEFVPLNHAHELRAGRKGEGTPSGKTWLACTQD